jgi:hypothetical protein
MRDWVTPFLCPHWLSHPGETEDNPMSVAHRDKWRDYGLGAILREPRPHARTECPHNPFNEDLGGEDYDVENMKCCDYCYCFICWKHPDEFPYWDLH